MDQLQSDRKLSILAQEQRWGHMGLGTYFTWGVADLVKLGKNQRLQNLKITMFLHKPSKHAPKGHIMRISPPPPPPPKKKINTKKKFINIKKRQKRKNFLREHKKILEKIKKNKNCKT